MITSLIKGDMLHDYDHTDLTQRLVEFGKILAGEIPLPRKRQLRQKIKTYQETSAKQTTDISRREARQAAFMEAIVGMR